MKKIIYFKKFKLKLAECVLKKPIFILNKSLFIIKEYEGLTVFVYNGKSFIEVVVSDWMIGHRFGEFVSTRKLHKYVKKKKK